MSQKGFCSKKMMMTLAAVLLIISASAGTVPAAIEQSFGLPEPLKVFVGKSFTYDLSKHFSESQGNPLSYSELVFLEPTTPPTNWMNSVTLSSSGILSGGAPTSTDLELENFAIGFTVKAGAGTLANPLYIRVVGEPNIAITPVSVTDSTSVFVGESSRKTFTVSNTGVADLVVSTVVLSGSNASEFTIQNDGCSNKTFTPGQSFTFDAVFFPTSAGSKTANITISSTDPDSPQIALPLTMSAAVREPNIVVTPLFFVESSPVFIGESVRKTFTVSNSGLKELAVSTITLSGDNVSEFTLQNDLCSNKTFIPGQSATFDAVFFPTTAGNKTAKITVSSNDPDSSQVVLSLSMNAATKLTAPPAPTLTVTIQGKTLTASWFSSANVSGYTFYYGAAADTASMTSIDAGTLTSYSTDLWEGAAFYLAIKAHNSAGSSNFSNIEFFRILTTPVLTVSASGSTVTASWTAVPGAIGYTLYYAPYPNADPIKSLDLGNQTGFSVSLPNSAFYIAVQAYNNQTTSGYSNIGNFITK